MGIERGVGTDAPPRRRTAASEGATQTEAPARVPTADAETHASPPPPAFGFRTGLTPPTPKPREPAAPAAPAPGEEGAPLELHALLDRREMELATARVMLADALTEREATEQLLRAAESHIRTLVVLVDKVSKKGKGRKAAAA
jgi:hypothetical protein